MKYSQLYLVTLITLGVAGFVVAAGAPVTHQFNGGDPASATQVNENFQELADRIDTVATEANVNSQGLSDRIDSVEAQANVSSQGLSDRIDAVPGSQVFDYHDYGTSATTKTFTISKTGTAPCGDTEIRSFVRVDNGNGSTSITMTRDRQSSSVTCQHKTFEYLATATEFQLLSRANNNTSGVTQNTGTFNDTLVALTSTMRKGVPFGSHTTITNDVLGDTGGAIQTVTVLGIEDVTVPAGTYTNCLKLHILRTSNNNGNFNRFSWRCPGMGEVKRVQHEIVPGDYTRWELSSIS